MKERRITGRSPDRHRTDNQHRESGNDSPSTFLGCPGFLGAVVCPSSDDDQRPPSRPDGVENREATVPLSSTSSDCSSRWSRPSMRRTRSSPPARAPPAPEPGARSLTGHGRPGSPSPVSRPSWPAPPPASCSSASLGFVLVPSAFLVIRALRAPRPTPPRRPPHRPNPPPPRSPASWTRRAFPQAPRGRRPLEVPTTSQQRPQTLGSAAVLRSRGRRPRMRPRPGPGRRGVVRRSLASCSPPAGGGRAATQAEPSRASGSPRSARHQCSAHGLDVVGQAHGRGRGGGVLDHSVARPTRWSASRSSPRRCSRSTTARRPGAASAPATTGCRGRARCRAAPPTCLDGGLLGENGGDGAPRAHTAGTSASRRPRAARAARRARQVSAEVPWSAAAMSNGAGRAGSASSLSSFTLALAEAPGVGDCVAPGSPFPGRAPAARCCRLPRAGWARTAASRCR